ncbi:sulfite exporter TauE/SafE family protein [Niveibacterium sp. 24ML]|uniref:sulfite exporter TauE/SafE family protein n=1 Tax=Niveibacterium sp. 24ML TaxID=2985512 RepID=UPI002B4BCBFB|nr:TSUP family transporter [Niveibacterium sp. 24ML]
MEHTFAVLMDWFLLLGGAFLAGLVDAVVGGGGLIQIPLLLSVFPATPIAVLFGTNKVSSVSGTLGACIRYVREIALPWRTVCWAAAAAFIGAWLGAQAVSLLPKEVLKPFVLVMLVLVGAYTFVRKDFGRLERASLPAHWVLPLSLIAGGVIGFYDGFFGPGTGSFLIFVFVRWFGFDFLKASASAKVVNVATNLAAIASFALGEGILWKVGALMAIANLAGSQVGAHFALKHGNGFIRWVFLVLVSVLVVKLGAEMIIA